MSLATPSETDPFILHLLLRESMSIMIVSTAFAFPLFGEYIRRAGQIQVLPENGAQAITQAEEFLKAGYSVGIFPDENFSPQTDGFWGPHSGATRLAFKTGVPVIPVRIYLPREHSLRITSDLIGKNTVGYWYLNGPYGITIGKPIQIEGQVSNLEQVRSQSQRIMECIMSLAQESEFRVRRLVPVPIQH